MDQSGQDGAKWIKLDRSDRMNHSGPKGPK